MHVNRQVSLYVRMVYILIVGWLLCQACFKAYVCLTIGYNLCVESSRSRPVNILKERQLEGLSGCLTIFTCTMPQNTGKNKPKGSIEGNTKLSYLSWSNAFLCVGLFVLLGCWEEGLGKFKLINHVFLWVCFLSPRVEYLHKGSPAAVKSLLRVCLAVASRKAQPMFCKACSPPWTGTCTCPFHHWFVV